MDTQITVSVELGDALHTECDVLVLKHAQRLYGVDKAVFSALETAGIPIGPNLPKPGRFRLVPTQGTVTAKAVLFIGVPELWQFDYAAIREFGTRALSDLSGAAETRRVVLTVHGPNYGLDELESFRAELGGLLDAIAHGKYPLRLETIIIVERNAERAQRLKDVLDSALPSGTVAATGGEADMPSALFDVRQSLKDVGEGSRTKPHVFAAMPFAKEFDDRFHYGIQRAAESAGFLCERADLTSFVGDVLGWVRERIASAAFVVADLTTANPNVYLEVGYSWGCKVPTVLLVSDTQELLFDVRSQRCLVYEGSIQRLEKLLTIELKALDNRYDGLTSG